MIKDYVKPEYKIVEYTMSNGKVRYNIWVSNGVPNRNLLTMSGYTTLSNQCKTFLYQKHELDTITQLHSKILFKNWLREVKEYALGEMTRPDNYTGDLHV